MKTRHVDHLNLNWTSLDDEGGRNIGIVLSENSNPHILIYYLFIIRDINDITNVFLFVQGNKNTVRVIELINNGIKGPGAVMIGRSLAVRRVPKTPTVI